MNEPLNEPTDEPMDGDELRAALLAQADQDCAAAYHDVLSLARQCHGLDIIEATRRLGLHLQGQASPDGLAFTLAYFALKAARAGTRRPTWRPHA